MEYGFEICSLPEIPRNGKFLEECARILATEHSLKSNPCDRLIIPYGDGLVALRGLLPHDCGWLGWASQEYVHGLAVRCSSPESIAAGIVRLLKDPKVPIASESTAQTFRVANSAEAFRQFWSGVC